MKILDRTYNESKIKKEFKQVLWIYDFWGRLTERKAMKKVLGMAEIKNGDNVLDVACGTGELLKRMVKQNPAGRNTGIDLSPAMLDKARKRLKKLHTENFELQQGNALDLDFPDDTFDVLLNNYMVDLLPESSFNQIAAEFYRVLKPGGRLVMSTFSFGTKRIHKIWYLMARLFPGLLTDCRPVAFQPYLENAGFDVEETLEISQNTFPTQVIKAGKKQV
ncbi:MAG TPA: methyltransferase domain-containing protein [Bacteroidales bacterium]|nr:methyltransferase domain-containing protein [Bacteroidales bacterium]